MARGEFVIIPNIVLDRLSLCVFKNSVASAIVFSVLRKSIGYHVPELVIEMEQFAKSFPVSRRSFFYAIAELKERKILIVRKIRIFSGNSKVGLRIELDGNIWIVDKYVDKYVNSSVYPMDNTFAGGGTQVQDLALTPYRKESNNINTIIKDQIQEEIRKVGNKLKIT